MFKNILVSNKKSTEQKRILILFLPKIPAYIEELLLCNFCAENVQEL